MTKTEIIQKIASENDCTQKVAGGVLDSFIKLVGEELRDGNDVRIMGFGRFRASLVEGREGKNPRNPKETMEIPDSMRIYFSAGKELKDTVNEAINGKKSKKKASAPAKKAVKAKKKKK